MSHRFCVVLSYDFWCLLCFGFAFELSFGAHFAMTSYLLLSHWVFIRVASFGFFVILCLAFDGVTSLKLTRLNSIQVNCNLDLLSTWLNNIKSEQLCWSWTCFNFGLVYALNLLWLGDVKWTAMQSIVVYLDSVTILSNEECIWRFNKLPFCCVPFTLRTRPGEHPKAWCLSYFWSLVWTLSRRSARCLVLDQMGVLT